MSQIQILLDAIRWSRNDAAAWLGVTRTQMRYWAEGVNSRGNPSHPPPWVVPSLRAVLASIERVLPQQRNAA